MTQPEDDIRQALNALIESWNTHDPEQLAASFTQDAQFTDVMGHAAEGRAALARLHVMPFARLFNSAELEVEQAPIKLVSDEVASVNLRWPLRGGATPQGAPLPPRAGVMHVVVVRRENRWWPTIPITPHLLRARA
ncbi:YybH family protein [Deinococcus sp.]|uniref:YybH family protein n=1 Tax=Deinococcus sp. TaxID=47478 RepID=UPI003CC6A674